MGQVQRLSGYAAVGFVPMAGTSGGTNAVYDLTRTPGQDPTQRTTTTANNIIGPILYPNGQKILYSDTGNLKEIGVLDSPGDEVMIWDGATGVTGFAYSSDGNTILFTVSDVSTRHILYTIPADGTDQSGNETAIYTDGSSRQVCGASYNFNTTKIAFHLLLSATSLAVMVCDDDGTNATQLDTTVTVASQIQFDQPIIAWMRGSSRLVWNDGPLAAPVWKTMLDDGTSVVTLGTLANGDGRPTWNTWAPDDSFIVRKKLSTGAMHKLMADGSGDSVLITPTSAGTAQVRVFGTRVYWDSVDDIWSCEIDGTDERNETGASAVNFNLLG